MSTTKTADKAQTAKVNEKSNLKKVETEKAQDTKSTETIAQLVNPTAEGRIQRIENFQLLSKRYKFLKNKREELERFMVSNDGTKEKLILKNASGFEFEVANTQVLEKVVELLGTELDMFLAHSQNEILAYTI